MRSPEGKMREKLSNDLSDMGVIVAGFSTKGFPDMALYGIQGVHLLVENKIDSKKYSLSQAQQLIKEALIKRSHKYIINDFTKESYEEIFMRLCKYLGGSYEE